MSERMVVPKMIKKGRGPSVAKEIETKEICERKSF